MIAMNINGTYILLLTRSIGRKRIRREKEMPRHADRSYFNRGRTNRKLQFDSCIGGRKIEFTVYASSSNKNDRINIVAPV